MKSQIFKKITYSQSVGIHQCYFSIVYEKRFYKEASNTLSKLFNTQIRVKASSISEGFEQNLFVFGLIPNILLGSVQVYRICL